MPNATAADAASIHIGAPTYTFAPARGSLVYGPCPIQPKWLANTQQYIRGSIVPNAQLINDGRWLGQDTADAAADFFQKTADLLPGEPFVYSSQKGDVVAEFKGERGAMTAVVSPAFVLLFAVIDGMVVESRVLEGDDLRSEVQRLTGMLHSGQHVAMDATR